MFQEIQEIVDDLAEDLDRAVVVEDEHHALIAHSPHRRQVDAIRERSVFMRQTPAEMIEWVATQGLRESDGPLRLPANPALGAESRICVPLRADGVLIGILAVLDGQQTLGPDAVERCRAAAAVLAQLLEDLRLLNQAGAARERELVDALLSATGAARAEAGAALIREGRLSPGRLTVVGVFPGRAPHASALQRVIRRARGAVATRGVAAAARADHAVLLVPLGAATPRDVAEQVEQALAPLVASGVLAEPPLVAYGEAAEGWDAVAAAHRHACRAARVARTVGELGADGPVGWEQLGVFGLLASVPPDELGRLALVEPLRQLRDKPELLHTLEVYLDLAGDAKRAAERLALHRASLYYRLHRIEELLAIDLKSGTDRLAVHVALKAARLTGPP